MRPPVSRRDLSASVRKADAGDRTAWDAAFAKAQEAEKHCEAVGTDASGDALSDAYNVLVKMPAPDADALLWKINYLFGPQDSLWEADYTEQFYADANRILAGGRA